MYSFTQVPNDIIRNPKITPAGKTILINIMSYNPSFPSYSMLQKSTGLCKGTISKALKELVALGVIEYENV